VVFSDKTLRAIAEAQPTTRAALLSCPGVGERKLEAYGEEFLRAVREYLAAGSCP
jgi:ATP-dependent DNA helicase RecQ